MSHPLSWNSLRHASWRSMDRAPTRNVSRGKIFILGVALKSCCVLSTRLLEWRIGVHPTTAKLQSPGISRFDRTGPYWYIIAINGTGGSGFVILPGFQYHAIIAKLAAVGDFSITACSELLEAMEMERLLRTSWAHNVERESTLAMLCVDAWSRHHNTSSKRLRVGRNGGHHSWGREVWKRTIENERNNTIKVDFIVNAD
jgi:hypothetical protein